jgi:hypothetical protein
MILPAIARSFQSKMKTGSEQHEINFTSQVLSDIRAQKRFRSRMAIMIYIFLAIFTAITALIITIG